MVKTSLKWQALVSACVIGLGTALPGQAKDVFVAQTALGNANGASAADAYSLAWLNTPGNWGGAGTIQPGDTVRLVGIFTSNLTIRGNGTAGSPITILFDPGAKFSAPTWNGPAIGTAVALSYVIIDGGQNGLIEATANGTLLANRTTFQAMVLNIANDSEVKNLTFNNLFVRVANTTDCVHAPTALSVSGTMTNAFLHNCNFTNTGNCIVVAPLKGYSTNIQVYSNSMAECSWGIYCEPGQQGAVFEDTKIWNNRINNGTNWDGCPDQFHQDGIIAGVPTLNSTNRHMQIFGNVIGPDCGVRGTSAIYLESTVAAVCNQECLIYNNVCLQGIGQQWNSGIISVNGDFMRIYNNTVICLDTNGGGIAFQVSATGARGADIKNNLVKNFVTMYHSSLDAPLGFQPIYFYNCDYNIGAKVSYWWNPGSFTWGGSTSYRDHVTYPQFTTFDNHSTINVPALDSNYAPTAQDTVAIGRGLNLTSYGITTDLNGNPRPASGPWTIGAFELPGNSTSMAPPNVHAPVRVTP